MEKLSKEIALLGITNSNVADTSNDGECCDIVNMRNSNGVWKVCGTPQTLVKGNGENRVCSFVHSNSNYSHLISYNGSSIFWDANIVDGESVLVGIAIAEICDVIGFEAMGNILIVICKTGNQYLIFNDNTYSLIGQIETPMLNFCLKNFYDSYSTISNLTLPKPISDTIYNLENYTFIAEKFYNSTVMDMVNSANQEKGFNTPFIVRYAMRLFDGSYIKPSAPILMVPQNNIKEYFNRKFFVSTNNTVIINTIYKNYYLYFNASSLPSHDWDDIISSIDIFISKPLFIASDKFSQVKEHSRSIDENDGTTIIDLEFPTLSDDEIKEKLVNESLFFKIAEFKLSELRNEKYLNDTIIPSLDSNELPTQEILPIDNFSHYNFCGDVTFLYNSRLHIGNIRRYLPQPFNISHFMVSQSMFNGDTPKYSVKEGSRCLISVLIKGDTGNKFVDMEYMINKAGFISPFISYPDNRATQMDVWIENSDGEKQHISLPLTRSGVENMSYFINEDYKSIAFNDFKEDIPTEKRNDYDHFPNLLRVSNLENPFFFPQELSYSISGGEILNIAAVTTELSQGRFGDFPLYIFTSDGIWALEQGSENVIYKSLLPVSRDIALSKKSIVNTDNAIIFLSEKGLMLLNGSNVAQISTFGLERYDNVKEREVRGKIFNITSSQNIVDDFKSYISSADIEFNYINNELLFLREGDNYMYAFSLNGGMWSRVAFTNNALNKFIKLYPQLLMADVKGNIYNLSKENETDTIPFIFSTRAIKILNNYTLKQIKEIIFKGELDYINDGDFTLEVEASNLPDKEFRTISKTSIKNSFADGVRIPIYAPSYKYFRVSGYGNAKSGMNINNILFTYTLKYNSRVR